MELELIEFWRIPGQLVRITWLPVDKLLDLSWLYSTELNWKGRALERAHALRRLPRRTLQWMLRTLQWMLRMAFLTLNEIIFAGYRLAAAADRTDRVRSVLQMSIPSSKPFMVSRAMRQAGLKSEYLAINADVGSGILNIGWDYSMRSGLGRIERRVKEFWLLWTVMARYDVIHSHFATMLSESGWEFGYLRRLGKVVIFTYRGCDLRSRTRNMQLFPDLNCCEECDYPVGSCDTDYQRTRIEMSRTVGDRFFVTTPDLKEFLAGSDPCPSSSRTGLTWTRSFRRPSTRVCSASSRARIITASTARASSSRRSIA